MSWGVLLVGDQPARQRCADRGQRLGAQQAENRQNRQCQASIPRKEACQNQALLERLYRDRYPCLRHLAHRQRSDCPKLQFR
jgi:hypothetical protein